MDTRLRNVLHDLASDMPVELETTGPPTLRKARGRRALTGAGAIVAVVAFVAVSLSAIQLVSDPATPVPTTTGPNATFDGLWPETSREALETAQEATNGGAMPLRTTPEGTASLLAVNLLGWPEDGVQIERGASDADEATVAIRNRILGDDVPPITVELRRLGDTGESGIWSVVDVSTSLIQLENVQTIMPETPESGGFLILSGTVTDVFDGATAIEAHVFDGPALVPSLGSGRLEFVEGRFDSARDVGVGPTPDGAATLLLTIPDATGASLGAVMVPVETPVGEAEVAGPNLTDVPADVAATAQRIYDAAKAKDFDAIEALLDPNTFTYNSNPGANPIPEWQANPSELDVMVAILELPPTTRDIGPPYGTFYFWPYLVNSDFSSLTPQELSDLNALGYSDEDIQLMIDGGTGYQGPRLAIDENGEWQNFITQGE